MVLSIAINNAVQFKQLAFQYYDNPSCVKLDEFENDVKIFNIVASTIEKYVNVHNVSERLLLNRIIITHNMFGPFAVPGLFWKVDHRYWVVLKTFLQFLNLIPEYSTFNDIATDTELLTLLKTI